MKQGRRGSKMRHRRGGSRKVLSIRTGWRETLWSKRNDESLDHWRVINKGSSKVSNPITSSECVVRRRRFTTWIRASTRWRLLRSSSSTDWRTHSSLSRTLTEALRKRSTRARRAIKQDYKCINQWTRVTTSEMANSLESKNLADAMMIPQQSGLGNPQRATPEWAKAVPLMTNKTAGSGKARTRVGKTTGQSRVSRTDNSQLLKLFLLSVVSALVLLWASSEHTFISRPDVWLFPPCFSDGIGSVCVCSWEVFSFIAHIHYKMLPYLTWYRSFFC